MKRLYILRHAKSAWALPGSNDIDRRLSQRGHEQTLALQNWFSKSNTTPSKLLCSSAYRTMETYQRIAAGLSEHTVDKIDALYMGSLQDYLAELWAQDDDTLMVIGHNPTCDELTRYLASPQSPAINLLMSNHFGTATLAILEFSGDHWNEITKGSCSLVQFLRPKMLEQQEL